MVSNLTVTLIVGMRYKSCFKPNAELPSGKVDVQSIMDTVMDLFMICKGVIGEKRLDLSSCLFGFSYLFGSVT